MLRLLFHKSRGVYIGVVDQQIDILCTEDFILPPNRGLPSLSSYLQVQLRLSKMRWLAFCILVVVGVTAAHANFIDSIVSQISNIFTSHEEATYNISRTAPGYEEREYPASQWACTEERGDSDEHTDILFWRLFKYISGENRGKEEMSMTIPVTTEFTLRSPTDKSYTMCFYLGRQHQTNPPTPTNAQVFIQNRPFLKVFTRTVGGYVESESEWMDEAGRLAAIIQENGQTVSLNHMYWVGYDAPLKFWYRRNEVWFPVN
ncbi:heme-binding protein 1-like [Homarus americanus]|uniref:heme-binding protein 1-like n=1 Tax=Homarus americanus TaxID=6706 RepID=UPI001C457DF3|nr:heme-binding protein 1-like [Homarus americanus]